MTLQKALTMFHMSGQMHDNSATAGNPIALVLVAGLVTVQKIAGVLMSVSGCPASRNFIESRSPCGKTGIHDHVMPDRIDHPIPELIP
jgi:hypothetical protein